MRFSLRLFSKLNFLVGVITLFETSLRVLHSGTL